MKEALKTIFVLFKEKKLHGRLIFRLIYLFCLSLIFGYITLHDIFVGGIHWYVSMGVFCAGFIVGISLYSRIFPIMWNEEREIVAVERIDTTGVVVLIVYIAIRVWVKFFLEEHYRNVLLVSGITFASLFGVMIGRLIGALIAIHRTHTVRMEREYHGA